MVEAFAPLRKSAVVVAVGQNSAKRGRGRPRKDAGQAKGLNPWLIKVNHGGLWLKYDGEPLVYGGGEVVWIHVKDRMQFGYGELMRAIMGRVTGPLPLGFFWFQSNGCKIPGGLMPLENMDDIKLMYMAARLAKETCSEIYVQDSEVMFSTKDQGDILYELPFGIERMDTTKHYNWFELSRLIVSKENEELKVNPLDRNWYVSTSSTPRKITRNKSKTHGADDDLPFILSPRW